jgi:hypothetical protein
MIYFVKNMKYQEILENCRKYPRKYLEISGNTFEPTRHYYLTLQITTPLKVLLLKKKNPSLFAEIMKMEAHLKERENTELWKYHQKYVVNPLLEKIVKTNYDPEIDEELLQKVCGILDVNTFEIRGECAEQNVSTQSNTKQLKFFENF